MMALTSKSSQVAHKITTFYQNKYYIIKCALFIMQAGILQQSVYL